MNSLQKSVAQKLFDAISAATHTSAAFALPSVATQITWQTIFDSAPSSVTILIETSLDNITWSTSDTSTATAGAIRTFNSSALFVRARISAISAGGATQVTVIIVAKQVALINNSNPTFDSLTVDNQITAGSIVLGTPYNPFNQSLNKTDDVIFDDLTVGTLIASGLTWPASDGVANQVIATNGLGHLVFIDSGLPLKNAHGDNVVSLDGNDNVQLIGYDSGHSQAGSVTFASDGTLVFNNSSLFSGSVLLDGNPLNINTSGPLATSGIAINTGKNGSIYRRNSGDTADELVLGWTAFGDISIGPVENGINISSVNQINIGTVGGSNLSLTDSDMSYAGQFSVNGNTGATSFSGVVTADTFIPTTGYKSVDSSVGITQTVTTATLVGKTMTFKNGLLVGFA